MTLRPFVSLAIAGALLLTGCGRKNAADSEKKPEEQVAPAPKNVVTLDDESLKLITLETVTIRHGKLDLTLRAPGRVSFDLNHTAKVTATLPGRIAKMNVDVGATVREGDVVAVVDSPELLKPLELKAPMSGEIVERSGTVGEMADVARELYVISDPTDVWVIADVSAADVAAVRVGRSAAIRAAAYPDETFTGTVSLVSPAVREQSRTVEVRIRADNPGAKLKPGMFVDVDIVTRTLDGVVAIPDEAVQRLGDGEVVFVTTDAHTFSARSVKTGPAQNGLVQILEGLQDGERAVTRGSFLLRSELLKGQYGE